MKNGGPTGFAALAICVLACTRILACGGRIYGNPSGELDDAGYFHAADGAVLFGPGTACASYDPTNFAHLLPWASCDSDDFCRSWFAQTAPPGYFTDAKCYDIGSGKRECGAKWAWYAHETPEPYPIYCTPGPAGDAFCSALLTQFVVGGGRAAALCIHQCDLVSPEHGGNPYCQSGGPDFYACVAGDQGETCPGSGRPTSNFEICVARGDAGYGPSEVPCQLPTAILDAGDDQAPPDDAGEEP